MVDKKRKVTVKRVLVSKIKFDTTHRKDLGDIDALATSIRDSGLINPIIIDKDLKLIAGFRRLKAVMQLGHKRIRAQFFDDLSEFNKIKVKIEEQLGKKDLAWPEEVMLKLELHRLYVKARSQGKKWTQKKTAGILGMNYTTLSQEIRLAICLEDFPPLRQLSSKREAIKRMYQIRERLLLEERGKRRMKKQAQQSELQKKLKAREQEKKAHEEGKKRQPGETSAAGKPDAAVADGAKGDSSSEATEVTPEKDGVVETEGVSGTIDDTPSETDLQLQSILDEVDAETGGASASSSSEEGEPDPATESELSLEEVAGSDASEDARPTQTDHITQIALGADLRAEEVYTVTPSSGAASALFKGDCFDIMKHMRDESVDLVITDPPYGIEVTKGGRKLGPRSPKIHTFDDTPQGIYKRLIPELYRIMRPGSHLWMFFGIDFHRSIGIMLEDAGFVVRRVPCVWIKERVGFSGAWDEQPMPQYENFFFAKKTIDGVARKLTKSTSDVFNYPRTSAKYKIHVTEKPVALLKRLINLSSVPGDVVFDPFAGSASTLISSILLHRMSIGIEIDKKNFERSVGRLVHYSQDPDKVSQEIEGKQKK